VRLRRLPDTTLRTVSRSSVSPQRAAPDFRDYRCGFRWYNTWMRMVQPDAFAAMPAQSGRPPIWGLGRSASNRAVPSLVCSDFFIAPRVRRSRACRVSASVEPSVEAPVTPSQPTTTLPVNRSVLETKAVFFRHCFLSARSAGRFTRGVCDPPNLLPRTFFGARPTWPLIGFIWPKDGCASIA
jgi:hypothetical protein